MRQVPLQPLTTPGVYDLLRGMNSDLHTLRDVQYEYQHEVNSRLTLLEHQTAEMQKDISTLKQDVSVLKSDVSTLKDEMKEVRRDLSDVKGSIRELAGTVTGLQTRFNWGLVILGLIIALIQMLK